MNNDLENPGAQKNNKESEPDYINNFDDLRALGSLEFGEGQKVSFQPWDRYKNQRYIGTVRLWEGDSGVVSISFLGQKIGIPCPDSERITRELFEKIKGILEIRKENP